jgi:hypothetical protein
MIVDSRRSDIGMPQLSLHLGNIGLVVERIGGRS